MSDFRKAHEFTARWEGGYVNHINDTGGETNLGVTRRVWEAWCRERGLRVKPMRALVMADVLPLYEARYWPAAADLPWPLSGVAYDIAVNHGQKNLAYMLGKVATAGTATARAFRLIDVREQFFRDIVSARPDQGVFLKGWLRRVNAQREWLKDQVAAPRQARVLLVPMGGGEPVPWDGRSRYNAQDLVTLVPQLQQVYASPGGPWEYGGVLRVWRRQNGDLVLERLPVTPGTIPATPPK